MVSIDLGINITIDIAIKSALRSMQSPLFSINVPSSSLSAARCFGVPEKVLVGTSLSGNRPPHCLQVPPAQDAALQDAISGAGSHLDFAGLCWTSHPQAGHQSFANRSISSLETPTIPFRTDSSGAVGTKTPTILFPNRLVWGGRHWSKDTYHPSPDPFHLGRTLSEQRHLVSFFPIGLGRALSVEDAHSPSFELSDLEGALSNFS